MLDLMQGGGERDTLFTERGRGKERKKMEDIFKNF